MSQEKAQLIAPQGHFTVPGLNVAGVVTASSFSGNCTGTASSLTQGSNVVVGVMTASSFAGDVFGNAAGLSTTTAGLKLGIVTSTSFAGNFTGIGSGLTGTPNIVAGLVTASQFVGNTPGLAAGLSAGKNLAAGIITATTFFGDGSNLTGAGSTAYIRQSVGSGTTIDLNNGNIIYFNHVGDTTVSFANTSTADDVTFIRPLTDPTAISISTGGVDFDGTGDFLSLAASTDFTFGTGAFTIEFWFKVTDNSTHQTFISEFDSYNYQVEINTDGKVQFAWGANSTSYWSIVGGTTISEDTWYHVAVVRNGNNFTQYLNGVNDGSFSSATSSLTTGVTRIGRNSPDNRPLTGVISNLRIVKGTAVYTTDFYPPSTELTNVADTKLLCCQSDSSTTTAAVTPGTITANGDPTAGAQTLTLSPSLGSAITWPTGVTWNGGSAPTLLGANSYSLAGQVFNLVTYNGGTNWYGYEEVNNDNEAPNEAGRLFMWGANQHGQQGTNTRSTNTDAGISSPTQIPGTTWDTISGSYGVLGRKSDGTMWGWGENGYGQLGLNDRVYRSSPVQVGSDTNWADNYSTMFNYVLATKTDGTAWSWGHNNAGQLGQNQPNNTHYSSPTQLPGTNWDTDNNKISVGYYSMYAIKTDGTMWSWGYAAQGQLGQNQSPAGGGVEKISSPAQIGAKTNWRILGGTTYSMAQAINTDGELWTWGTNTDGHLGVNDTTQRSSPVQVPGTTWNKLIGGHSLYYASGAIKTDGTLWVWGRNNDGILGQNNLTKYSSPVQIPGTTWDTVSAGVACLGATKTDGTLWTWGNNNLGRLGLNQPVSTKYSSPVQVPGTTWTKIGFGGNGNSGISFGIKT